MMILKQTVQSVVKSVVWEKEGIPTDKQYLTWGHGSPLAENKTLAENGVVSETQP